jgi:hypothetical protein
MVVLSIAKEPSVVCSECLAILELVSEPIYLAFQLCWAVRTDDTNQRSGQIVSILLYVW